jgi:hypothetical protein
MYCARRPGLQRLHTKVISDVSFDALVMNAQPDDRSTRPSHRPPARAELTINNMATESKTGTFAVKVGAAKNLLPALLPDCMLSAQILRAQAGMAQMLKGGVIMDVVDVEQAKIAEQAGVYKPRVC